jgi:hypothetical protein
MILVRVSPISIALLATVLVVSALLVLSPATVAGQARGTPKKVVIPKIAGLAGVQIGHSTQEDLARRWGEGKTIIGGHPNSGRIWRVKGTSWAVYTDGFEYSQRGLVIDGLRLMEGDKESLDAPFARPGRKSFAWLGGVTPGMSRSQAQAFLKRKSLFSTEKDGGFEIRANGFRALASGQLETWTVRLKFAADRLTQVIITTE